MFASGQIVPTTSTEDVVADTWSTKDINAEVDSFSSWLSYLFQKKNRVGVDIDDKLLHDVTADLRQLVKDLSLYRKKLRRKYVAVFDAYWGFTREDMHHFLQEIDYHAYLTSWRGDDVPHKNDVAVSKSPRTRSVSFLFDKKTRKNLLSPAFRCRGFTQLWKDLLQTRLKTQSELDYLRSATISDTARGERIFMLFKQDLLQGIQSEVVSKLIIAQSTSSVTQTLLRNRTPISKGRRLAGWILFVGINIVLLLYILLFSLQQSNSSSRLLAFASWLAIEVLVVSTLSLVLSHIVTPLLALVDLKQIYHVLREAMANTFEQSTDEGHIPGVVMREKERRLAVQPVVDTETPFICLSQGVWPLNSLT